MTGHEWEYCYEAAKAVLAEIDANVEMDAADLALVFMRERHLAFTAGRRIERAEHIKRPYT